MMEFIDLVIKAGLFLLAVWVIGNVIVFVLWLLSRLFVRGRGRIYD